MPRAGITYADVAAAATAITASGQNPTVDRVLAYLGRGSKSTIGPHLRRWKQEQIDSDPDGLPAELVRTVKALHEGLLQAAEEKIREAELRHEARVDELQTELQADKEVIVQLTEERNALESRCETLAGENNVLRSDLEAARIAAAGLESALQETRTQVSDAKGTIAALRSELSQLREQFEHYEEQARLIRDQERADQQQLRNQMESRIRDLSKQLQLEQERNRQHVANFTELQQAHEALQTTATQAEQEAAELRQSLAAASEKENAYLQRLEDLEVRNDDLSRSLRNAEEQLHEAISTIRLRDQEIVHLTKLLDTTNKKWVAAMEDLRRMESEKAALEERMRLDQKNDRAQ